MYSIRITRQAVKDIASLAKDYVRLVSQHVESLGENPRPSSAKRLKGTKDYSLRVGAYRIIYDINDEERVVTVYRVKHRREAYR